MIVLFRNGTAITTGKKEIMQCRKKQGDYFYNTYTQSWLMYVRNESKHYSWEYVETDAVPKAYRMLLLLLT